ncbi:arogenate dehydratase/prephenate dehydratase 1, chloroplastic-like [Panicum miliaceum]|uniref:Arogenate dehydratase/prephenate dehydratase 1, chloroplastic-like n=1 Tax=Panicum miliaceum TaxID=4540 RepID=A0A3L6QTM4_PANMI|nr:arogenate dehydratase/prephenate dehydratase 1, chloroplastic-like [Panicum miliaceum]
MGDRDGDEGPPPGSVVPAVMTTPGARKLAVKGPLISTDLSLHTERSNVLVTYQGSPGTVIEAMVLKAFQNCIAVPHKRSEGALEAVESSLADKAVLTIENSSIGSFHQSYDLLLSHNLQIVQEVQMDVELCLLALPGVQKDDLQTIFSHPQVLLKTEHSDVFVAHDLAQCEYSLSNLGVSKKNVDHGAAGAEIISKQNLRDAGVIGSARSAELYGLNILECNFQDASPNITRYLVLAVTANIPNEYENYKTSIVFGLEEGPGTLHKALVAFWKRDLNLTKIESRPNRGKPMRTLGTEKQFNYIFYVDFEASVAEIPAQNALKELEAYPCMMAMLLPAAAFCKAKSLAPYPCVDVCHDTNI